MLIVQKLQCSKINDMLKEFNTVGKDKTEKDKYCLRIRDYLVLTSRFLTASHPQTSDQVKNTNRALKRILEKTVRSNLKNWSDKLDDALWAFRTAFKTPIGSTSFRVVYGKACHLPVEIEHKAFLALKICNMDHSKAGVERNNQLNELEELRLQAYETSKTYKERIKKWHDNRLKDKKEFQIR
ncbi:reverse transcriptase domain-containing protein [Tanacetum coccineum]